MKRLLPGLLGIILFGFGSCHTENIKTDMPTKPNTLSVHVTANGIDVGLAKTRATLAPESGEDKIGDLYLLFFEPSSSQGGAFVDLVSIEGPLSMDSHLDINLTETNIDVLEAYNVLAIANIDGAAGNRYLNGMSVDSWILQWVGKTEGEVMSQATAWAMAGFDIKPSGLLMNGRVEKGQSQFHLDLVLSRNQVRFDVLSDVKSDYELLEVQVRNAYPSSAIWNQGAIDYTENAGRIPTYYSYTNPNPSNDIVGSLYAFENQVPMPVQNDHFTTALLIQLRNTDTGKLGWYRVNIMPFESAQILKRDNAYRLTIQNVGGPGAPTAEEAYDDPNHPELDYVINFWDQNNAGVIVQDGSSILSIPSKTVRLEREGGASTYQIFAFTNSSSPVSPLTIIDQDYNPGNGQINAVLSGSTLTITATAMSENDGERRGTITLGFAGLRATIEVIQSNVTDDFIQVILPNNTNIPAFAPFAGVSSELIRIAASGAWTAEIFTEYANAFSFESGLTHDKISSTEPLDLPHITDNRFRLYTISANPDSKVRDAFIVVSLDKDPENHAVVFRISQAPTGGISILPNQPTVTFNGNGTGLAQIVNNTTTTFNVRPDEIESGQDVSIAEWEYRFRDAGSSTWENTSEWFSVVDDGHSTTDASLNKFTVKATGQNLSGTQRTSTLRLLLSLDNNTYVDLQLVQQPLSFSLQPNMVPVIAKTGGRTQDISVAADKSLTWKASITTNSGTASDGRRLVQHNAKLYTADGEEVITSKSYPMDTKFYVEFPKVYYPNRDISISATVTVTVAETLTQTLTVTESSLTANGLSGLNIDGGTNWGLLGNTYNQGWDAGLAKIPTWRRITPDGSFTTATINPAVTYLHVVPQRSGSAGTNWNWNVVNDFIRSDRGWTVITQQSNDVGAANNDNSPIINAGYKELVYSSGSSLGTINTIHSNKKLYKFVMDQGMTPLTADQITENFHTDGIRTSIPGGWPESAVVFITGRNAPNNALLIVDIEHGFMYIGESQLFWRANQLTYNRGTFMDNLLLFIGNAAMYGTHFTDLLLEDGHPNAQPAPWDANHWGNNIANTLNGVPRW